MTSSLVTIADIQTENLEVPRRSVRTVATQLSGKTFAPTVRSKATQTTETGRDACVGTTTIAMDSLESLLLLVPTQRPRKRRRLELEDEEEEAWNGSSSMNRRAEPNVPASGPPDSANTPDPPSSAHRTRTCIAYENCLLELFQKCPVCMEASDARTSRSGTFMSVLQTCPRCKFTRRWNSQPVIGSTPAGNLQLSSAVYATGSSFSRLQRLFKAMNLNLPDYDSFLRHARTYIEPAIVHTWRKKQNQMMEQLSQQQKAVVRGRFRTDSPGCSARFGCYTVMEQKSNKVIDLHLVQSDEVYGRDLMEKEGLKRSLSVLEEHGVTPDSIVTDRHPETQKLLMEANITQCYDVGGVEKGISKRLSKISESRRCVELKKWLGSIKNHVYWTAASSTSGAERLAKWTSILNHIRDVHTHDSPVFPRCLHPENKTTNKTKWMTADAPAFRRLKKVMTNEKMLRDVEKLSPHDWTSSLEAFHSDTLRFASKNAALPFRGKLCRLYLATLHYNENCDRPQAAAASGDLLYRGQFPRSKKSRCTAEPVQAEPSFNYVDELMDLIFEKIICDPAPYVEELLKIPIPDDPSAPLVKADKLEVISNHVSKLKDSSESAAAQRPFHTGTDANKLHEIANNSG